VIGLNLTRRLELRFHNSASLATKHCLGYRRSILDRVGSIRGRNRTRFYGFWYCNDFSASCRFFFITNYSINCFEIIDFFGPIPLIKSALKDARRNDLIRLVGPMALILPLALWILSHADQRFFHYLVSSLAICLILCLLFGIQYKKRVTIPILVSIGGFSGLTSGFLGMPGFPVILFYLAGPYCSAVVRANTLLFLFFLMFYLLLLFIFLDLWNSRLFCLD